MDPSKVPDLVVQNRLAQVADQLSTLPSDDKKTESVPESEEDDLLDGDDDSLKQDTPAPSPPRTPAELVSTIEEPILSEAPVRSVPVIEEPKPTETLDVNNVNMADGTDSVADRVQHIFGKRRASDVSGSGSEPKISNNGSVSSAEEDAEAVPEVNLNYGDQNIDNNINNDDNNMDVGDNNVDAENDDNEEGEWPEEDDQPEAFPDVGFPMEPPSYPSPPELEYRYRAGARSTPQRRRVDFNRAIVLRSCRRDSVTGRIPQQEYDAREDAEMMASLGYVFIFIDTFWKL